MTENRKHASMRALLIADAEKEADSTEFAGIAGCWNFR
jgi:hypothetical protein